MRLVRLWHELLGSLWPIPLACLLGGIALALTTIAIDRRFDYRLVPVGLSAAGLGRAPPGRRRRPPGDPPAGGGARQQGIGSVPDLSAVDHRTEASQQPPETRRTIT
jgi:hypothetical protein